MNVIITWLKNRLCGQELAALKSEVTTLSTAFRNASDKASKLQDQVNELASKECPNCATLKQVINFHVFAAGSKVAMFDGVGPTLPQPKELDLSAMQPVQAQRLARDARLRNSKFIQDVFPQINEEDAKWQAELERSIAAKIKEEQADNEPTAE